MRKLGFILKMVFRGWWRNKLFFLIAVVSLSIGLACTNLLLTYFIHDYHIEHGNPYKEQIYCLRQDNPMESGKKVAYVSKEIPQGVKEKIQGVEDFVRIQAFEGANTVQYEERKVNDIMLLGADASLNDFFPIRVLSGTINQLLTTPNQVAMRKDVANRLFGKADPLGKTVEVGKQTLTVVAILAEQTQSLLKYDLLTGITADYWGGVTFLKLAKGAKASQVQEKIRADKSLPPMMPGMTNYYVDPLEDMYFVDVKGTPQQSLPFIQQANVQLLYIGLFAAILILIIACCNYTNMSVSRLMQQLKMIYVEKLMGGGLKEIRLQLFADVVLTVALSFGISLLIVNDSLSTFNAVLNSRLQMSFFFSGQILPFLVLFLLIMALIPAWYISRKMMCLSYSEYKTQYSGKRKRFFVSVLVIIQFAISCGLILATLIAYQQKVLLFDQGAGYQNTIVVGDMFAPPAAPLKAELEKRIQGIESISLSNSSILNSDIRELPIQQADGSEQRSFLLLLHGDEQFLSTLHIEQIAGKKPEQIRKEISYPVLVNESYVRLLVPQGEDPIGKSLRTYDRLADSLYVIGGVVRDFPINSIEDEITPALIYLPPAEQMAKANVLHIRLRPENRAETLRQIAAVWQEMNQSGTFAYEDLHQLFMERNSKVISFTHVLTVYAVIGLLLTLFGLFGISWYATRQRIREISIRKLHGAKQQQILWLLNKPFTIYTIVAYAIAMPFTYHLLRNWLEQFAYHVSFGIFDFILPFVIIWVVSVWVVCVQAWLLARIDPIKALKVE